MLLFGVLLATACLGSPTPPIGELAALESVVASSPGNFEHWIDFASRAVQVVDNEHSSEAAREIVSKVRRAVSALVRVSCYDLSDGSRSSLKSIEIRTRLSPLRMRDYLSDVFERCRFFRGDKEGSLISKCLTRPCPGNMVCLQHVSSLFPGSVQASFQLSLALARCSRWGGDGPLPRGRMQFRCDALTIVSAASASYFGRLLNLVGSVQFWEPQAVCPPVRQLTSKQMLLFSLDLSRTQMRQLGQLRNVRVRSLDLHALPAHVDGFGWERSSYAFKPLIVNMTLAEADCVL